MDLPCVLSKQDSSTTHTLKKVPWKESGNAFKSLLIGSIRLQCSFALHKS